MKKKWKKTRLILVPILVFMMVFTSIAPGTLLAEQPASDYQVEESEKRQISEDDQQQNTEVLEDVTLSQNNTEIEKQTIANKEAEESAVVIIGENGWSNSVDEFNLTAGVSVPAGNKGNKLTIHLPKYIELKAQIMPGGELKEIEVNGSADLDTGTEIILSFNDTTDMGVVMGKDIRIGQKKFIEESLDSTYDIRVTYTNGSNVSITNVKTYNPAIDAEKEITGKVVAHQKGIDIPVDVIFSPVDHTFEVEFTTGFKLNAENSKGNIVVEKDSSVLQYYDWKGEAQAIQHDGSIVIPIIDDMYTEGGKKIQLQLPFEMKDTKKIELSTKNEIISFHVTLMLDNNKTANILQNYYTLYLSEGPKIGEDSNVAFTNLINEKFGEKLFLQSYTLMSKGETYMMNSTKKDAYRELLRSLVSSGVFEWKFKIPENIIWKGDSSLYDGTSRIVTLNNSESIFPYSRNIIFDPNTQDVYAVSLLLGRVPLDYFYDFDKVNNTPSNLLIAQNSQLFIKLNESSNAVLLHEILEKTIAVKSGGSPINSRSESDVLDKTEDIELFGFNLERYREAGDIFLATPKYSFSIDFQKKSDINECSINDIYDVKRIELVPSKGGNSKVIPMNVKVETNKGQKEYVVDEATYVIELEKDEIIYSMKVEGVNSKDVRENSVNIKFIGDVNVKEDEKFFGSSDSREFSIVYATSLNILTEDEKSDFHKPEIGGVTTRTIKKIKKVSLSDERFFSDITVVPYDVFTEKSRYINFPSQEFGVDKVTFILDSKFVEKDLLRISEIRSGLSWALFSEVQYTTKNNGDTQIENNVSGIKLEDGDYFTSLSFTITDMTYLELTMSGTNNIPSEPMDINMFKIAETEKIEESFLGAKKIKFKEKAQVTYEIKGFGYATSGGRPNLGNLNPGNSVSLPMALSFTKSVDSSGITLDKKIYNPTFYIQIPENFDYEEISFNGSMFGKKPRTTLFNYKDVRIVKVEFFGDGSGETGYYGTYNDGDMTLKLVVNKFAKAGSVTGQEQVYMLVDLSADADELVSQNPILSTSFTTRSNYKVSIMDPDTGIKKTFPYFRHTLSYNILQEVSIHSGAEVNSDRHLEKTDDLSVRSGEEFNALITFYNNMGIAIDEFTMYIPVAQKENGIEGSQDWSAKLIEAGVDTTGTISVSYSTNENPTTNKLDGKADPGGMYVGTVSDFSEVTMVKLSASKINASTLIRLEAKIVNREPKDKIGEQVIKVKGAFSYKAAGHEEYVKSSTNDVTVRLVDTKIKGLLFIDENENGIFDFSEKRLSNQSVSLYDKDDNCIDTVKTNTLGEYQFMKSSLNEGDYVKIDKIKDHVLTWKQKGGANKNDISYFDQESYKAIPTLENAEYLNAGFIESPEITLDSDTYTIKMKKTETINYEISDGTQRDVKFESADDTIAKVDENGVVTPITLGKTKIKVYYLTASGIEVSTKATIIVQSNDAPVITAPDTVTMNVNDLWDPKDPSIVEGLNLTDDHDAVSIDDLYVEDDEVPVGSPFLFIFKTADTDRIQSAGTYRLKYSYTDKDGNKAEKIVKVKVNGQPYLTDLKDNKLTENNMPHFYFRLDTTLDPFQDVKAYYEKAGNNIGDKAVKTEISKDDENSGIFQLVETVDNEGKPVVGSPSSAGLYKGTYYVKTPSEAKSNAEISLERKLYAQGKIEFSGHNIAYPSSSNIHSYRSWDEFYDEYKDKIQLSAKLDTPNEKGQLSEKDILDTVKVIDPNSGQEVDFSKYDFSLPEGEITKSIMLTLRVYDDGKAEWNSNLGSVYGEVYKDIDIIVTVQEYIKEPPHIHFKDIERITTDQIRDVTSDSEKDLSTDEAMEEAKNKNERALYNRLMNDVTFSDPDGSIEKSELLSIKRISKNPDKQAKEEYNPNNESEIREMMQTVGTYKIIYSATDNDKNQIFAERTVYVAGPTVFVKHMSDLNVKPDSEVNIVKSSSTYVPTALYAYHLDSNEVTNHETTVIADQQTMNIKDPGTYEVIYKTSHHFKTYPDEKTERPNDIFKVAIRVHGSPKFNKENNEIENLFVDQTANLDEVTASFAKASESVGGSIDDIALTVDNDQNSSELSSASANTIDVKFTADASHESNVNGNKATLKRTYKFYGLPEIEAVDSIRVKADITAAELKSAIAAKGKIAMPDGNVQSLEVEYDFTNMDAKESPSVLLKVSYTLSNNSTRTKEKTVRLEKVDKPVLEAKDIVYNVGDPLNIIEDSEASGVYDGSPIAKDQITFDSSKVPVDADGKLTTPATYKVTLAYEDQTTGNRVEKEILVKVNGLPEIHEIEELEKRVGDDIDVLQKVYVTWMKAPDTEGAAIQETFNYSNVGNIPGAKFELKNTKNELTGEVVDFSALNTVGYYSGEFYAMTPSGAEVSEKQTLLLHGKPVLEANAALNLSKNVGKPNDFLGEFGDRLALKASVERAYRDEGVETIDLTSKITVSEEELEKIKYREIGHYPITISVSDSKNVAGSQHNTITKTITVNIVDVDGTPPTITTPSSVQRVVDDEIGLDNSRESNIAQYLIDKAIYSDVQDNRIMTKELISIDMIKGPKKAEFTKIENPTNDELKTILNSVGEYEAVIEVIDEKKNKVQATLKIEVAGKTEFGYDVGDDFVKLEDVLNVRQSDNKYGFEGIYARHMEPDGDYHKVGVNKMEDVDISTVSVKHLTIDAPHHYVYYDDDPNRARGNDSFSYDLLVQGKITILNAEDIFTRVGTKVEPLKNIVSEEDSKDVYAVFDMIDKDGNIEEQIITPTSTMADTSSIGKRSITITATDEVSGAADNVVTKERSLYVYSVPNISYNEQFNVGMDANENDLKNGLNAKIQYQNSDGDFIAVPASDITINYGEVSDQIKKYGAGKKYPLSISVKYMDNGIDKTITKTSYVYVLNGPATIVEIPKYLNLKDEEGTDQISAKATVNLYKGNDKDSDKDNIPEINIFVDKEIELRKESASFKAYSYKKDDTIYDGKTPIMKLKYGKTESDYFYLKADKADIDSKNIGIYQGTLNFIMEYEGD